MIGFLIFLAAVFGYIGIATVLTPVFYKRLRGTVTNHYQYLHAHDPNHDARTQSYIYSWLWPVAMFLFAARMSMFRVDARAELDKQERAELEKFRAAAIKEVEQW